MTKNKKTGQVFDLNEGFTKRGGLGKKPSTKRPAPPVSHVPKTNEKSKE